MTPPRLHVLTATDSPAAVVLRRGPSGQVATVGWDRAAGTFALGQWLKGRIFAHRSDLSPDGRHMIYFAGTGDPNAPTGGWWTAISRAPWLRALVLLPQSSTWGGGGAFTAPGTVWLNGGGSLPDDAAPELVTAPDRSAYPHSTDGFHMGDTFAAMLERRGWRRSGQGYEAVLTRPISGGWTLEQRFAVFAPGRAAVSSRFALVAPGGRARRDLPEWDWADLWDGHLHYAAGGALHCAGLGADGALVDPRVLRDFSEMRFEARPAPYDGASRR